MHSSELEDEEEVGVMGTELLPVKHFNELLDLESTKMKLAVWSVCYDLPDDPFVLLRVLGFLFLV